MSLLKQLKEQYDEQLANAERVPIKIPGIDTEYFVAKGVITAHRKNQIAVAANDGALAYAAGVVINTLRRASDGKFEFAGITVKKMLTEVNATVIDDLAAEIQKHVLFFEPEDSDVAGEQEAKPADEVEVAAGNLNATHISSSDSI